MNNKKFIFFGTPRFAAIILEKLISAGFIPAVVVCNPDKPTGRKKLLTKPLTKIIAEKNSIKTYQPQKLEIGNCLPAACLPVGMGRHGKLEIGKIVYDFAIVAAYGKIIPSEILKITHFGTIGIHPSLLPKYRGATPIQSAILNGDVVTGTTLFLLDEQIDHGNIIAQRNYQLARDDTYTSVEYELAERSTQLIREIIPEYIAGKIKPISQNESQATYTKKFTAQDGFIEPTDLEKAEKDGGEIALTIDRKIRALNPEPGVWTIQETRDKRQDTSKRIKLLEAEIIPSAGRGKLKLKKIQIEGKLPITIDD